MTDIVERLNGRAYAHKNKGSDFDFTLYSEAADTITALRAEVEALRGALGQIRAIAVVPVSETHSAALNGKAMIAAKAIARAALKGEANG